MSAPREFPQALLIRTLTRIIRNFFFITKAIRKWLAIKYNDGLIPGPPVRRRFRIVRSTPRDSYISGLLSGSLKHSPINRRYSEPPKNYDLATALKERHNRSQGTEHRYYVDSHSSDYLGVRFLLSSLAQSFIGYIEDPDEEKNKREATVAGFQQKENGASRNIDAKKEVTLDASSYQQNASENLRRNALVVESVHHDAEQQQRNSSSFSPESEHRQPLPVPNFDETNSPEL